MLDFGFYFAKDNEHAAYTQLIPLCAMHGSGIK